MKRFTLLFVLLCFTLQVNFAQRYIDDVFTDVTITPTIYGENATIAPLLFQMAGDVIKRPLNAEVYTPTGDMETQRPLVILLHTGNFLPPVLNGGCGGTIHDADMVNFATRLAKKGYVVAVADYRIGWNPGDPDQESRAYFLINASYRGVQDANTCVRYFKKTVAEDNNPWGVDPNKIAMWGFGTGGYITYGAATLQSSQDTWITKFTTAAGPMIFDAINGDIEAKTYGFIPEGYPLPLTGDTLCHPNHVDYSSEFQMSANSGGALGDTSWIDAADVPMISFQVPTDPFAPCEAATLIVPGLNFAVVEVMGACMSQPIMNAAGVNDVFNENNWNDPYTDAAIAAGGSNSFFPLVSSDPAESAPWNYASSSNPYGLTDDPGCDTESVLTNIYADSMMAYFTPRACLALSLDCIGVAAENLDANEVGLTVQPNPASDNINFRTKDINMESIYVYDMNGRLVKAHSDIHNTTFEMKRHNLPNGIYVAQLRFPQGVINQRIIFH